jgi:glutamate 5-kinase
MSLSIYHRIVVKIGSNVLTDEQSRPDLGRIAHLVEQVAWLRSQGAEVILVSSGAVAMGRSALPQLSHVNPVLRRQVWASVGQPRLMQIYQQLFENQSAHIAQLLVTKEDFRDREHYLNMKACLQGLLRDEMKRINMITPVPIAIQHHAVRVNRLKRHLTSQLQPHHQHAHQPKRQNVAARHYGHTGVIRLQTVSLQRPALRHKWPQGG